MNEPHRFTLIFLHGVGEHPESFIELFTEVDKCFADGTKIILPLAPRRPVTLFNKEQMPSWFDIKSFKKPPKITEEFLQETYDQKQMDQSVQMLDSLVVEEIRALGDERRVILGGFQQGASVCLAYYLKKEYKIGAVISLSGLHVACIDYSKIDIQAKKQTQLWLYTGTQDPIISYKYARSTFKRLQAAGLDHYFFKIRTNMYHEIAHYEFYQLTKYLTDLQIQIEESDMTDEQLFHDAREPYYKQYVKTGGNTIQLTEDSLVIQNLIGDIATEKVDSIVNSSGPSLLNENPIAYAIEEAAGKAFEDVCDTYHLINGYVPLGLAAVTGPCKLPCKNVIHAILPMYLWKDKHEEYVSQLKSAVKESLKCAEQLFSKSVSIPAIGSDLNWTKQLVAQGIMDGILEYLETRDKEQLLSIRLIRLVHTSPKALRYFQYEFRRRFPDIRVEKPPEPEIAEEVEPEIEVHHLQSLQKLIYEGGQNYNKPTVNKNHLRLYGHNFCPFVARARYALSAAKIDFQEVAVNMEDKSDWHMAVSRGLIPVLEFPDKEFLTTSKMIIDWVVSEHNLEIELVPVDNEKFIKLSECMNDLNDLVNPIYMLFVKGGDIDKFVKDELPKHEKRAKEASPFLLGRDKISIIDIQVGPFWELLYMFKENPDKTVWNTLNLAQNAPHLCAYIKMFRELDMVKPYRLDETIAKNYFKRGGDLSTVDYDHLTLPKIENCTEVVEEPQEVDEFSSVDEDEFDSEEQRLIANFKPLPQPVERQWAEEDQKDREKFGEDAMTVDIDNYARFLGMVSSKMAVRDRPDIRQRLENKINTNKIVVFSKSTCDKSMEAKKLFEENQVWAVFSEVDWQYDGEAVLHELENLGGTKETPQIFISGAYFGGSTALKEGIHDGTLADLLTKAGVQHIFGRKEQSFFSHKIDSLQELPSFRPQIRKFLLTFVKNYPVVAFTSDDPFSAQTKAFLRASKIKTTVIQLDMSKESCRNVSEELKFITGYQAPIPAVFVGGVHIGGNEQLLSAADKGELQIRLIKNDVTYDIVGADRPRPITPKRRIDFTPVEEISGVPNKRRLQRLIECDDGQSKKAMKVIQQAQKERTSVKESSIQSYEKELKTQKYEQDKDFPPPKQLKTSYKEVEKPLKKSKKLENCGFPSQSMQATLSGSLPQDDQTLAIPEEYSNKMGMVFSSQCVDEALLQIYPHVYAFAERCRMGCRFLQQLPIFQYSTSQYWEGVKLPPPMKNCMDCSLEEYLRQRIKYAHAMVYTDDKNPFPQKQLDLFEENRIICTVVKIHFLQRRKECEEALSAIAGDLQYPLVYIAGKRWVYSLEVLYEKTMNGDIARMLQEAGNPVRALSDKELDERWGPKQQTQDEYNRDMIDNLFARKYTEAQLDNLMTQLVESEAVLLFSHTECERSWAVKKIFNEYYVDLRVIELDEIKHGQDWHDMLVKKYERESWPYLFLDGKLVGGEWELEGMVKDGSLETKLTEIGIMHALTGKREQKEKVDNEAQILKERILQGPKRHFKLSNETAFAPKSFHNVYDPAPDLLKKTIKINTELKTLIETQPLVFFSRLDCGFCQQVKNLLLLCRVKPHFVELDFVDDGEIYTQEMAKITGHTEVPILYVKGKYIGGYREIRQAAKDGSFLQMLAEAGIKYEPTDIPMYAFDRNFGCCHSKYIETGPDLQLRKQMMSEEIEAAKVFVYCHSMGDESMNAKRLLTDHGVKFGRFFVDLLHLTRRSDAKYGSDVEKELFLITGSRETPHIFIDGEYFGDYTKLKAEAKNGILADKLTDMDATHTFDPDGYESEYIDAYDDKYGRLHKKFGMCYSKYNFCPSKPTARAGIRGYVERMVAGTEVLLFSDTRCTKSQQAKALLTANNTYFNSIELNQVDPQIKDELKKQVFALTGHKTTPLLFVAGKLYPPDELEEGLKNKSLQRVLLGHDDDIDANRKLGNCHWRRKAKAQLKVEKLLPPDMMSFVRAQINSEAILLYSSSACKRCAEVKQMLDEVKARYSTIEQDRIQSCISAEMSSAFFQLTGQPGVPQLFINGKYIGGHEEIITGLRDGRLQILILEAFVEDHIGIGVEGQVKQEQNATDSARRVHFAPTPELTEMIYYLKHTPKYRRTPDLSAADFGEELVGDQIKWYNRKLGLCQSKPSTIPRPKLDMHSYITNMILRENIVLFCQDNCEQFKQDLDQICCCSIVELNEMGHETKKGILDVIAEFSKGENPAGVLFVKGKYIGGHESFKEMKKDGTLAKLLAAAGVKQKRAKSVVFSPKDKVIEYEPSEKASYSHSVSQSQEESEHQSQEESENVSQEGDKEPQEDKEPDWYNRKLGCIASQPQRRSNKEVDYLHEKINAYKFLVVDDSPSPQLEQTQRLLLKNKVVFDLLRLDKLDNRKKYVTELELLTGQRMLPIIFIGGKYFGGNARLHLASADGTLNQWCNDIGVENTFVSHEEKHARRYGKKMQETIEKINVESCILRKYIQDQIQKYRIVIFAHSQGSVLTEQIRLTLAEGDVLQFAHFVIINHLEYSFEEMWQELQFFTSQKQLPVIFINQKHYVGRTIGLYQEAHNGELAKLLDRYGIPHCYPTTSMNTTRNHI